jgi:hypothetical protein
LGLRRSVDKKQIAKDNGDLIVKVLFVSACGGNMREVCVSSRSGHLRKSLTVSECLSENRNLIIVIPHGTESTGAIALASFKRFFDSKAGNMNNLRSVTTTPATFKSFPPNRDLVTSAL